MKNDIYKVLIGFILVAPILGLLTLIALYPFTILIVLGIYFCWIVGDKALKIYKEK